MSSFMETASKIEPITGAFSGGLKKPFSGHGISLLASPLDPGLAAIAAYKTAPDDEEIDGGDADLEETSALAEKEAEKAAAEEERKKLLKKDNRRRTILTSGQGVEGLAPVEKKTLLGQ